MPIKKREKSRLPSPGSASTMSDYDINSGDELPSDDEISEGGLSEEDVSDEDIDDDMLDAFDNLSDLSDDMDDTADHKKRKGKKKEEEADYETAGRSRWAVKDEENEEEVEVGRLPIKLPTGEVQQVEGTTKIALPQSKKRKQVQVKEESDDEEEEEDEEDQEGAAERMASVKGKFGRMGVAEIVAREGWKNVRKLEAAKEQIAALGAEILAGGELIDTVSTTMTKADRSLLLPDYPPSPLLRSLRQHLLLLSPSPTPSGD
jgi:nucleolar complex protein 3